MEFQQERSSRERMIQVFSLFRSQVRKMEDCEFGCWGTSKEDQFFVRVFRVIRGSSKFGQKLPQPQITQTTQIWLNDI